METYPDYPGEDMFDEDYERGLVRLSRVRYQVAEGQPDAMGWRVADIDGQEFGHVSDLLADAVTGQIIFVAITDDDTGKTSLVPVEGAYLDTSQSTLALPVSESTISDSPEFNDDVVDVTPFVDYWMRLAARESG